MQKTRYHNILVKNGNTSAGHCNLAQIFYSCIFNIFQVLQKQYTSMNTILESLNVCKICESPLTTQKQHKKYTIQ